MHRLQQPNAETNQKVSCRWTTNILAPFEIWLFFSWAKWYVLWLVIDIINIILQHTWDTFMYHKIHKLYWPWIADNWLSCSYMYPRYARYSKVFLTSINVVKLHHKKTRNGCTKSFICLQILFANKNNDNGANHSTTCCP